MADILKFPTQPKAQTMDHELDIARELMVVVVEKLREYRYEVDDLDSKISKDLGLIYHMFYAMMLRNDGQYHQFHDMMDEIMNELEK